MADEQTINYYKKWKHEKNRAVALGKDNYAANCNIELQRLETQYPELVGVNCNCGQYSGCTG